MKTFLETYIAELNLFLESGEQSAPDFEQIAADIEELESKFAKIEKEAKKLKIEDLDSLMEKVPDKSADTEEATPEQQDAATDGEQPVNQEEQTDTEVPSEEKQIDEQPPEEVQQGGNNQTMEDEPAPEQDALIADEGQTINDEEVASGEAEPEEADIGDADEMEDIE